MWVLTLRDRVALREHTRTSKDFCPNLQVLVFVGIGFIWAMASITVGVTMSARTRLDRLFSQHGTRLALFGITILMLFHII